MGTAWSADAARYLLGSGTCPRCDRSPVTGDVCPYCQAVLTGPVADELRDVSARAAALLTERQEVVDRLPTAAPLPVAAAAAGTALAPPTGAPRSTMPPPEGTQVRASSQLSVQSVLAVAGAGLVAVAAFVFTYLNADFTSVAARNTVIGIVTVVFLGMAWLLAARGIRFSAEAIGALGMGFVALDISALVEIAPDGGDWAFGALGTLVSSAVMLTVAVLVRLRSWLWISLLGLALTPAIFAGGFDEAWAPVLGALGVAVVGLAVHLVAARLGARLQSPLRADRTLATVLQLASALGVVLLLLRIDEPSAVARALGSAAALAALALLAGVTTRFQLGDLWRFLAPAFGVAAVAVLPFALDLPVGETHRYLAFVPAGAAVATILVALLPWPSRLAGRAWAAGTVAVLAMAALPAAAVAIAQGATAPLRLLDTLTTSGPDPDAWAPPPTPFIPDAFGLAIAIGLGAAAVGTAALAIGIRRWSARTADPATAAETADGRRGTGVLALALWLGVLALSALVTWTALSWVAMLAAALALSVALAITVVVVPPLNRTLLRLRLPLVVGAHAVLAVAATVAASLDATSVVGGIGVVVAVLVLSRAMPAPVRALYIGVADAYGLIVFAHALDLAGLETIIVLCLTTSLAILVALTATLVRRVPTGWWYAILLVTLVPFLIGVASVIGDRSGWTALSTGLMFLLALTLVATSRPGLTTVVRVIAAALLVPSLAVVVVCLTSQFLDASGSPVALPIIAVIIACTLAAGRLIRTGLTGRVATERAVRAIAVVIEGSAFLTSTIAVLLAITLPAAGYDTAVIVLLVLGIGSAAARVFAARPFGWWVAGVCFTGALWCVWALAGVDVIEPYLLPPALGAATVGALLLLRRREGAPLVATGLAAAVLPTLIVLAVAGNGTDAALPWRAFGLLGGSAALFLIGLLLTRRPGATAPRLAAARIPVLLVAIGAAAGGAIEAVRIGLGVEVDRFTPSPDMPTVLAYSLGATVLAAASGLVLRAGSRWRDAASPDALGRSATTRWLLAPAVGYLVIGPVCAAGPGGLTLWTLWSLTLFVLAIMVASTLLRGRTVLPPVWFLFLAAWCTAVAGWSSRDLNVEWFSLPLGLALLACGILAMLRPGAGARRTLNGWPAGFTGSWRLLAPGIVVTLLASILATGTNPAIWRAIVVIGIALVAILLGSLFRLAAPFIIGLIVLPVENIIVFAVLLSRNDGALPWWITLAVVGAVLLAIAVNSERRTANSGGFGARLRDLT